MVSREKIKQVVEILKNTNRLQKNQLVRRIVDEGLMSHQTANDAINEAVNAHQIIREEAMKGNVKIVFFTVYSDIAENEKEHLTSLQKWLEQFDIRFNFFKKNYSKLSIEEKAAGLEAFGLMHLHFHVVVEALWRNFGRTNKWSSLLKEIRNRSVPLNELMTSGSKKEHGEIAGRIIEGKMWFLNESIKQLDENLHKIKRI